jgi:hypothetical protein
MVEGDFADKCPIFFSHSCQWSNKLHRQAWADGGQGPHCQEGIFQHILNQPQHDCLHSVLSSFRELIILIYIISKINLLHEDHLELYNKHIV